MRRTSILRPLFAATIILVALPSILSATNVTSRIRLRQSTGPNQLPPPASSKGQSTTLLPNGTWLFLGGETSDGASAAASTLDPLTGVTTALTQRMVHARAWHTATVLPDGTVFIFGGTDQAGRPVGEGELFDPQLQTFSLIPTTGLAVSSHHTATLLLSGQVLIAGGVDNAGEVSDQVQLFDPMMKSGMTLPNGLIVRRRDHTAVLLPDGDVLFWGGIDRFGSSIKFGEVFDHVTEHTRFEAVRPPPPSSAAPSVTLSMPIDGETDVATNTSVAILFSKPIRVSTFQSSTATLIGPHGNVLALTISAEGGMLGFVTPSQPLEAGTTYSLLFEAVSDSDGQALTTTEISFTTMMDASSGSTGTGGMPMGGGGMPEPFDPKWQNLPPLHAHKGITALAGQTLQVSGKPLKHVRIQIDDNETHTDDTGRFLLEQLTLGHHVMNVYGETAEPKAPYGFFQIAVDIDNKGQTNVLPFTIFIPVLDVAHATHFSVPTDKEVVATTLSFPGMEVHIPAGEILRWVDGKPITEVTLTAIPMMQMPMPGPPGIDTPISFTLQADGAVDELPDGTVGAGVRIIFPNVLNLRPGTRANFWTYDPKIKGGWFVYGQGSVTKDGMQIVPDPGVVIHRLSCSPFNVGPIPPGVGPRDHSGSGKGKGGEPVDLSTGLFVYQKTDMVINDIIPIIFSRTYRQLDNTSRAFGIGTEQSYGAYLYTAAVDGTLPSLDLVLPDGGRVHFVCISSDCSGGTATVLQASSDPGPYFMSQISLASALYQGQAVYNLRLKSGEIYGFIGGGSTGRLGYVRDRNGNQLSITSGTNGLPVQITSPGGRWIKLTYDTSNRITQLQDNIGRTVSYIYDVNGCLHTVTDANGGIWTYTYDANNNMQTITDARQILYLTNQYNGNNQIIKQTQADNSTYQFSYTFDVNGNITQTNVTNPRGDVRVVTFNSSQYWGTETVDAASASPSATLVTRGGNTNLPVTTTDALGRQTTVTYDLLGNILSVTSLAGTSGAITTTFTYEPEFNQMTSRTDALGHITRFNYDPNGNIINIVDALNNSVSLAYSAKGQLLSATSPLGNTVRLGYDPVSLDLTSFTDPLNRTFQRFVDGVGRLVSLTDPFGQSIKFAYNPLNEILGSTDPHGNKTSLAYDANGNLQSVTDANLNVTNFTYDNMDRLSTRKDALQNQESYQYDATGNLAQFTDRRGEIATFNYDTRNRLAFAGYGTVIGNPTTYGSTVTYTYDAGDRLTQAIDSQSGTTVWALDGLDRLITETTSQGSISYSYNLVGRRTTMSVPGQSVANYTYDAADRLVTISQGTSNVQLSYDTDGRRTLLTLPNGITTNYSYDSSSQLIGLSYVSGSTVLGNLSYGYDALGRRMNVGGSFARTGLPNAASTAAYNANNQLTTWGTANLFYDANGNMTSDGTHSYGWDARNRLAQIDSGATATFVYEPFGRRTSKNILSSQTGFLYDGVNAVQELSGTTPMANSLTGGIDEVFQRTDAAGARSFLADALGSTLALTDTTGAVQTQYTFDPFANTTFTGAASTNSFAYTGRELDATGLYFYRARYYNPQLQRFISEDPLGFGGGDMNLYGYVSDSPTNFVDPLGLSSNSGPGGAGGSGDGGGSTGSRMAHRKRDSNLPSMSGPPRNCSLKARIFKATDFNFKEGLDIEAGVFDVGLSRNINFETNATTVQAEIGAFGVGFNAQRVTDSGYLNPDFVNPNTEFTGHVGPYEKNLVSGESKFSTSKLLKLGFAVGGGVDLSFDVNKFKEITVSCTEP